MWYKAMVSTFTYSTGTREFAASLCGRLANVNGASVAQSCNQEHGMTLVVTWGISLAGLSDVHAC